MAYIFRRQAMISVLAPLPTFLHPPYVISSPSICAYRETLWSFSTSNLPNPTISPRPPSVMLYSGRGVSVFHLGARGRVGRFGRGGDRARGCAGFCSIGDGRQGRKAEDGRSRGGKGEETLPRDSCKKRRRHIYCIYVACFFTRISQYIHPV